MMPKSDKSKDLAAGLFQTVPIQTTMGKFFSKVTEDSPDKQSEKKSGFKTRKEKFTANLPSNRRSKKRMWGNWAAKDTEEYRNHYPGKKDHPEQKDNLLFYTNEIKSKPDGDKIDNIHSKWFGDYELLERHHGYIQWLFPIRESGLNWHSQELQLHEIDAIMKDTKARERILTSYKMMLDFYGMRLKDEEKGEIERAENWKRRFRHLNSSYHNYLRITRILKCLGEFGYEHLEPPFVKFVLQEGFVNETLDNLLESCERYWIAVIRDEKARDEIWDYYDRLYHVKYADEQTDDTENASAEQEEKQKEKPRKLQTTKTDNDDSDQDTMEYAMKLISDSGDDDDDLEQEEERRVAKTERKVHDMSDSSEDSQEANYWRKNDNKENAGQGIGIDIQGEYEMRDHSDELNDESVTIYERCKKEMINAGHKNDERVSDEVIDEQNNDISSDEINEIEKDIKSVDTTNVVDKDGKSEDIVIEISGRNQEEKHCNDKEDNEMIQEADAHGKSGNTENIETGIDESKVDKSDKDDDQEISKNTSKRVRMKVDGTEALDNDDMGLESPTDDLESDKKMAEKEEVDSILNSTGDDKRDSSVNVPAAETNQCVEKMNITEVNTDKVSKAAKDSGKAEDMDVD